jgi:steroid Delta-isomerase
MDDVRRAVDEHAALFNASVLAGEWSLFIATFADDAVMRFTNVPVGPYEGRSAIAAAYAAQPPDDTMTVLDVDPVDDDAALVRFAWDSGGTGTMALRWRDGEVADLTIAFD